jgi:hypothetical protein
MEHLRIYLEETIRNISEKKFINGIITHVKYAENEIV